jgi:hypothetical protein
MSLERALAAVQPSVKTAAEEASRRLRELGVRHALIGGIAVGAHDAPRNTTDVNFLVGLKAFRGVGARAHAPCRRPGQSWRGGGRSLACRRPGARGSAQRSTRASGPDPRRRSSGAGSNEASRAPSARSRGRAPIDSCGRGPRCNSSTPVRKRARFAVATRLRAHARLILEPRFHRSRPAGTLRVHAVTEGRRTTRWRRPLPFR